MHTCKHVIVHRTHRRLSGETASILFIKSIELILKKNVFISQ